MSKTTINGVDFYPRESDAKEAFAVRYAGKKGPVLLLIPGMGDRSPGNLENLVNVIDGYDYDGNGPMERMYAVENTAIEAFAKKYGFTLVTVTYPNEFNANDHTYVFDMVQANYDVDGDRLYEQGFSLGGGSVLRNITSSLANAQRLAGAGAAAPVNWATNIDNIVNAGLQFIGTTYETDETVSSSNVKNFVAAINAKKPKMPAFLKVYPGKAHGGFNEILADESYWQWMATNSRANRIPYTGTTTGTPTTPTQPTDPTSGLKAIATYTEQNGVVKFDGSKSTGATSWTWSIEKAPDGVNIYKVYSAGTGYKTTQAQLTANGQYIFVFTVGNGKTTDTQKIVIDYVSGGTTQPVPKVVASFDGANVMYTDGTSEKAVATYITGKWQIKTVTATYDL